MISTGDRCPFLSSLMGTYGSSEVPGLGAEVYSLVEFFGCMVSWVVYEDWGLLGASPWPPSSFSESSGCIMGCIELSLLLEPMSYMSMTTVTGVW